MKDPTAFPMALAQANYELQARITELAQSGGQYWYDLVQRLVNDGVVEGGAELQEILHTQDWQRLLALPADAFWRQLQQRFGDQQATTQIAVAAQASFARGVQDALGVWQRDTIAALDQADLGTPALDPSWAGLFAGWETLLPDLAFSYSLQPAGEPASPGKAAPGKPPARKSAASQAAAKKTAAKKPAAKKATARKPAPKQAAAGKAAKRAPVKKPPAKKAAASKAAPRPRTRH